MVYLHSFGGTRHSATIYRWRVRDLTKQRNNLRNAVDEGVKEISQQKNLIEAHAKELLIQNEELKHRNAQISEQKTQLAEMNRKVQEDDRRPDILLHQHHP